LVDFRVGRNYDHEFINALNGDISILFIAGSPFIVPVTDKVSREDDQPEDVIDMSYCNSVMRVVPFH